MRALLAAVLAVLCPVPAGAQAEAQAMPLERARLFAVPSDRAAAELPGVLAELGFRLRVEKAEDGLFITRATPIARLLKQGLVVSAVRGAQPREVEVHGFVSREVEPAHVHVDAIVTTVTRHDGTASHAYSEGEVERQILDALERRLGVKGEAIPLDLEARREAASRLLGGRAPACEWGAIQFPQVIPASKGRPMYPAEPQRRGESGKLLVLARILSDGSALPIRVLRGAEALHTKEMETAALAAIALWRYRPARNGTCVVETPMTVSVDFSSR